uniref:BPTI/Kunitz inhibitor domain-containing protein n=1 Tax=Ditylenchus dipsaci TaxID=166011 RepID=A0A915CKL6_9BILA
MTTLISLYIFLISFLLKRVIASLPDPPIFAAVQHYPSLCYLPPDSGLCAPERTNQDTEYSNDGASKYNREDEEYNNNISRLLTRYYFDMATEQCYPFGAQNCGGNENRFETLLDCQKRCRMGSFRASNTKL